MRPQLRVDVLIRNNRLLAAREELGMTQAEAARQIPVPAPTLSRFETLRGSPLDADGNWLGVAKRIANFYGVSPSDLWPAAVLAIEKPSARAELDADRLRRMIGAQEPPSVEEIVMRVEIYRAVIAAIDWLPSRLACVIRWRFGLEKMPGRDHEKEQGEPTLREMGRAMGLSRESVRLLESDGLAKLRVAVGLQGRAPVERSRENDKENDKENDENDVADARRWWSDIDHEERSASFRHEQ